MTWIVSTITEPATAHDTEAAANRVAAGRKGAVVWFCDGVEEPAKASQPHRTGPRTAVERVLGHLGVPVAAGEEIV